MIDGSCSNAAIQAELPFLSGTHARLHCSEWHGSASYAMISRQPWSASGLCKISCFGRRTVDACQLVITAPLLSAGNVMFEASCHPRRSLRPFRVRWPFYRCVHHSVRREPSKRSAVIFAFDAEGRKGSGSSRCAGFAFSRDHWVSFVKMHRSCEHSGTPRNRRRSEKLHRRCRHAACVLFVRCSRKKRLPRSNRTGARRCHAASRGLHSRRFNAGFRRFDLLRV